MFYVYMENEKLIVSECFHETEEESLAWVKHMNGKVVDKDTWLATNHSWYEACTLKDGEIIVNEYMKKKIVSTKKVEDDIVKEKNEKILNLLLT